MLIRTRLISMGFGSILLTTTALTAVGVWQTNVFHAQARQEVGRLVAAELTQTTRSTYDLIQSQDQSISRQVDGDLNTARHVLMQHGPVGLSPERVTWTAANQFTKTARSVVLPKMLVGGLWLGRNATFAKATPVVDEVSTLDGAAVTIFQRMDAQGDLLRVGTNVRTRGGQRAIGTYIPVVNPDGRPNPVVMTVLSGRTYHGNAYVVNAWYVSDYQPLFDGGGRVIGALFTGIRQESAPALRRAIQRTRVGKTGAVTVLGGAGAERGRCRISPGGGLDGHDLWDARDADGGLYIRQIVAAARGAAPGESATVHYRARRPGRPSSARVAQVAYYAPWDWVVVAETDTDDFRGFQTRLREGQTRMILTLLLLGGVIAGGVGVVLYREACQIAGAAREVSQAAGRLAGGTLADFSRAMAALGAGDLGAAYARLDLGPIVIRSSDEVGAMAASFNAMQEEVARAAHGLDGAREGLRAAQDERDAHVRDLRESRERYELAVRGSRDGLWDWDLDTGRVFFSPRWKQMLGYEEHEVGDGPGEWQRLLHAEDAGRAGAALRAYLAGETADYEIEFRMRCKDGTYRWILARGVALRDAGGRAYRMAGSHTDVTGRKQAEGELRGAHDALRSAHEDLEIRVQERTAELMAANKMAAMATTDPITGLPNHRAVVGALDLELERAARSGRPCALLFLDIDHFKALNDGCGHIAGDAALAEFGAVVRGRLRETDTVGRWGGEEFVALLPDTDSASALVLAEAVRETVASHGFRAGGGGHLTCSLGLAVFPSDAEDRSGLVAAADRAMYAAKRLGRNQARCITDPAVRALGAGDQAGSREEATLRGEVEALAALVAARDRYTGQHTDEVAALAIRLALSLGQDTQAARMVGLVGQLHDVGKVATPDAVLQKPGRLTEEEWALMRQHPVVGADVVSRMPSLRVIAPSIRGHHERWDGNGYPDGLAGEAIPLAARIVAVADAYGAMTTDRPYRRGMAPARALVEMRRCAGTQFDAEVVAALARTVQGDWDEDGRDGGGAPPPDPAERCGVAAPNGSNRLRLLRGGDGNAGPGSADGRSLQGSPDAPLGMAA